MNDDYKLTIEIENFKPIELVDFTNSLLGMADEFHHFLIKRDGSAAGEELKLYIKKIHSSSIVTEIIPYAPYALPIMEYAKSLIDFGGYAKTCIEFFIGKKDKEVVLEMNSYKNFNNFLEPIAKDRASQLNFHVTVNGDIKQTFNINSIEANAAQNTIRKKLESMKEPVRGIKEKELLYWFQARKDTKCKAGDRAIIESIYPGHVTVVMEEDIKIKMLGGSENPFNMAYIVDVEVQTIRDKPIVYKILKLHDMFNIDDDNQIKMFK